MNKKLFSYDIVCRVVDSATGLVDFVASSNAVDSYGEVVSQDGFDMSRADRNLPLVDSHNYSSVANQIGTVTQAAVRGGKLVCRCKFAIDVPENEIARLAFGMVKAGYLKACSIGFIPLKYVTPNSGEDYDDALEKLELDSSERPSVIYTSVQLAELSVCILGANPDALVQGGKSAGLSPRAVSLIQKKAGITSPSTRITEPRQPMKKLNLDAEFEKFLGRASKQHETLFKERKGQSESAMLGAVAAVLRSARFKRRLTAAQIIQEAMADEETSEHLRIFQKQIRRIKLDGSEIETLGSEQRAAGLSESDALGTFLGSQKVSQLIIDLTGVYGICLKTVGVHKMPAPQIRSVVIDANPTAVWWGAQAQATNTMNADVTFAGAGLTPYLNSLGILVQATLEVLQDSGVDLSATIWDKCGQGLGAGLDNAVFAGTGAPDGVSGGIVGIFFAGANVPTYTPIAGTTKIQSVTRDDLMASIGALNPLAIQRGVDFWTNPALLPAWMSIEAGASDYLVKTPLENDSEDFSLCGFPLHLVNAAPAVNGPSAPVLAAGHGMAFNLAMRDTLDFTYCGPLDSTVTKFRAIARGFGMIASVNWFNILTLSAE